MTRKQKILELKRKLQQIKTERLSSQGGKTFTSAIEEMLNKESEEVKKSFNESPTSTAIRALAEKTTSLEKKDPRIAKIIKALKSSNKKTTDSFDTLSKDFDGKVGALIQELRSTEQRANSSIVEQEQHALERFNELESGFRQATRKLSNDDALLSGEVSRLSQELEQIFGDLTALVDSESQIRVQTKEELVKAIDDLERRIISRIATINSGGGNMNRNIAVNGNQSVLNYFTDINLKAGNGVTITYATNQATNFTDITIAANGSGTGIVREVNNVAVNTAAGSTSGTDYVYVCTGTINVTLPTAVGNTNLYTVKNAGVGVITIDTTGGETIDGDLTVVMPLQYTSVDLISNGTNWQIT